MRFSPTCHHFNFARKDCTTMAIEVKFVLLFALLAYTKLPLGNATGTGQVSWEFLISFKHVELIREKEVLHSTFKKVRWALSSVKPFTGNRYSTLYGWCQLLSICGSIFYSKLYMYTDVKFVIWFPSKVNHTCRVLSFRKSRMKSFYHWDTWS